MGVQPAVWTPIVHLPIAAGRARILLPKVVQSQSHTHLLHGAMYVGFRLCRNGAIYVQVSMALVLNPAQN